MFSTTLGWLIGSVRVVSPSRWGDKMSQNDGEMMEAKFADTMKWLTDTGDKSTKQECEEKRLSCPLQNSTEADRNNQKATKQECEEKRLFCPLLIRRVCVQIWH